MSDETEKPTVLETSSSASKTKALIEAARKRNIAEQKANEDTLATSQYGEQALSDEEVDGLKNRAEILAETKVQPRNGTLTGEIDIEAMGDVKGDGGDAKNYADDDPAKALGVPVYKHGLASTRDGVDEMAAAVNEIASPRHSARTQAEIDRGRDVLSSAKDARSAKPASRTVVTDVTTDPEGEAGRKAAETKAKAAAASK